MPWAVCLVSFYGMLHKHHLLPGSCHTFHPSQQLVRSDFQIFPWGALVTIWWSKTIQFREQVVQILLPLIPDSPLCPVIAIQRPFSFVPKVPPPLPRKQKRAKVDIRPRMSLIVIVKPQSQDFLALNLAAWKYLFRVMPLRSTRTRASTSTTSIKRVPMLKLSASGYRDVVTLAMWKNWRARLQI